MLLAPGSPNTSLPFPAAEDRNIWQERKNPSNVTFCLCWPCSVAQGTDGISASQLIAVPDVCVSIHAVGSLMDALQPSGCQGEMTNFSLAASHTFHEILMNGIFIGCWAN